MNRINKLGKRDFLIFDYLRSYKMELSQEEKDHIIAEEKLRMETRKEFLKENFGHGGYGWRGGWHSYGCHRRCGGGLFKVLAVVAIIFVACHFWHHSYCGG